MENSEKSYPSFDFTVTGFEKLRQFIEKTDDIDMKIEFFEEKIQTYDEKYSHYLHPIGIDFWQLLELEHHYWSYVKYLKENANTPKCKQGNIYSDLKWADDFVAASYIKSSFYKQELFDFEIKQILEHLHEIKSTYTQILYLKYVHKEFVIQIGLYPNTYTRQNTGDFVTLLLEQIEKLTDTTELKLGKAMPNHRPTSKTSLKALLYFATMLEKLRTNQTYLNYNQILMNVQKKYKISKYTLPNWLKSRLRYIDKDIRELTEADMIYIWNNHHK